jgi:hypothetical protein
MAYKKVVFLPLEKVVQSRVEIRSTRSISGLDIFFQRRKIIIEIYPSATSVNRLPLR